MFSEKHRHNFYEFSWLSVSKSGLTLPNYTLYLDVLVNYNNMSKTYLL